jgi:hypothetical protein
MEQVTVAFHRGIPSQTKNGQWIRSATIRNLTGSDEQMMADMPPSVPPHSKVAKLLAAMTSFQEGQSEAMIKKMSVGDRVSLLLNARKLMMGDTISCTVDCPKCKKSMSVDLSISKLLNIKHPKPENDYEIKACGYAIHVKPLTAEDQDLAAANSESIDELVQNMARACIVQSEPGLPADLPEAILEAIGSQIEEIDPLSDISFNLSCAECNHAFQASFDAEDFVFREIGVTRYQQLEREIHWLAFHYHWSEKEILSLPSSKRKRYVELVNATLAGESV